MKIQLQSLRVLNCGPLRDICIEFNTNGESPTTVLAGANGSGKTTIIELCFALLQLLDKNSNDFPTLRNGDSSHSHLVLARANFAQVDLEIERTLSGVFYSKDEPNFVEDIQQWQVALARRRGYTGIKKTSLPVIDEFVSMVSQTKRAVLDFSATRNSNKYNVPSILFFPHTRSLVPLEGTEIHKTETLYQWTYRYEVVRSFPGSLDSYLIWLDYAEPEIYAQVVDFLDGLDLDGKRFGVQRKELRAIVTTKDGHTHGVAELSSGEQNILIMLLELRRRLLPYSIVLIDEIENSLHAAFQHRLAQGLKRLQAIIPFQLIVTTHSSEFARIFGPESVRILTEF